MKNVRIEFEHFEGDATDLAPKYNEVKCHITCNAKMGDNFRMKARMVVGRHTADVSSVLSYSYVVPRDIVYISFTVALLNDLKVLLYSMQNAFLSAKFPEKIRTRDRPAFGLDYRK